MGQGGLHFLSLIVSELWRHQWRHERCGLHPRPWTT